MLCWIRWSVLHSSSGILQGTMRSDMAYLLDPGRDFICCRSMLWHCLIDRLPSPAILNLLSLVTDWHTHKCVLYKIWHFTGALQHFAEYICLRSLSVRLLHFCDWKQVHTANKGSPVSFACCVMLNLTHVGTEQCLCKYGEKTSGIYIKEFLQQNQICLRHKL